MDLGKQLRNYFENEKRRREEIDALFSKINEELSGNHQEECPCLECVIQRQNKGLKIPEPVQEFLKMAEKFGWKVIEVDGGSGIDPSAAIMREINKAISMNNDDDDDDRDSCDCMLCKIVKVINTLESMDNGVSVIETSLNCINKSQDDSTRILESIDNKLTSMVTSMDKFTILMQELVGSLNKTQTSNRIHQNEKRDASKKSKNNK